MRISVSCEERAGRTTRRIDAKPFSRTRKGHQHLSQKLGRQSWRGGVWVAWRTLIIRSLPSSNNGRRASARRHELINHAARLAHLRVVPSKLFTPARCMPLSDDKKAELMIDLCRRQAEPGYSNSHVAMFPCTPEPNCCVVVRGTSTARTPEHVRPYISKTATAHTHQFVGVLLLEDCLSNSLALCVVCQTQTQSVSHRG